MVTKISVLVTDRGAFYFEFPSRLWLQCCNIFSVVLFFFFCRQKALKALNERMSKLEQPANWPSMDDVPSSPNENENGVSNGEVVGFDEEPEIVVEGKKDDDTDNGVEAT